jgi:hypothetical protein
MDYIKKQHIYFNMQRYQLLIQIIYANMNYTWYYILLYLFLCMYAQIYNNTVSFVSLFAYQ